MNEPHLNTKRKRREYHGHAVVGRVSNEYRIWCLMVARCENVKAPAYKSYGGRGIKVCRRWRDSFAAFLKDMGPRPSPLHSMDRIDNDGNYEPGNVRWATWKQQMRNMRKSKFYTYRRQRLCLVDWAAKIGVTPSTLWWRLRNWDEKRALSTAKAVTCVR